MNSQAAQNLPKPGIQILVLLNHEASFAAAAPYLMSKGYSITYTYTFTDTMALIAKSRPDIVLVSWNLQTANVMSVVGLLKTKIKIRYLVFVEELESNTLNEINKTEFVNPPIPPLKGAIIHSKLQKLLPKSLFLKVARENRQKLTPETFEAEDLETDTVWVNSEKSFKNSERNDLYYVRMDSRNISSKTIWQERPSEDGTPTWEGVSISKKGHKTIYRFKGPNAPEYNFKEKKWEEGSGGLFFIERKKPSGVLLVDKNPNEDIEEAALEAELDLGAQDYLDRQEKAKIRLQKKKLRAAQRQLELKKAIEKRNQLDDFSLSEEGQKNETEISTGPSSVQVVKKNYNVSLLVKCLQESLDLCYPISNVFEPVSQVSEVGCILVDSQNFKGYLVCVKSDNAPTTPTLAILFAEFESKMASHGMKLKPFTLLNFKVPPFDFNSWGEKNSELIVNATDGGHQVAFGFIPVKGIPALLETQSESYMAVEFEKDLVENQKLLFDVFLHLPKNEKFIRFLKKNDIFDSSKKTKLLEHETKKVYVKTEDTDSFFKYCAQCRILQTFNE